MCLLAPDAFQQFMEPTLTWQTAHGGKLQHSLRAH